jgi:hypothetical protein
MDAALVALQAHQTAIDDGRDRCPTAATVPDGSRRCPWLRPTAVDAALVALQAHQTAIDADNEHGCAPRTRLPTRARPGLGHSDAPTRPAPRRQPRFSVNVTFG